MSRQVKTPDGVVHNFPDDATDQEISEALNAPPATGRTTEDGKARSWIDTAKDVAIGVGKGALHTALDAGELMGSIPVPGVVDLPALLQGKPATLSRAVDTAYGQPGVSDAGFAAAREDTGYTNTPQRVGGALETVAELAVPVKAGVQAIPTTAKAGAKFQEVMGAAKGMSVDVAKPGNVALRIRELADRGASMPKAVSNFITRATDPKKGPLVYEEARDFASNISRLSVNEMKRLSPTVAREVAQLRVTLNEAIAETAKKAGKLAEYRAAMKEYAQAMRLRDAIGAVIQGAKKAAPYAGVSGAGYWLTKKIERMVTGE